MNARDLQEIESVLDVRLTEEYRRTMTASPAARSDEFFAGGLFNRPGTVIERTRWLAEIMNDHKLPWQKSWVVVAEVSGGDGVILDTASPGSSLLAWDHETNRVESFGCTVTQLAEQE